MKKSLKINLSLSLISLCSIFPLVACQTTKAKSLSSLKLNKDSLYTKHNLSENVHIKKIIDFKFKNDETLIKNFINNQNNIVDSKINELASALTWYPPFRGDSAIDNGSLYAEFSRKSKNVLIETIKNDWLWFLNNLKNMEFVLNSYGEFYKDIDNKNKEELEAVSQYFPNITIKFNETKIIDAFEYKLPNVNYNAQFKDLSVIFIILDANKVIKFYKYLDQEDQPNIFLQTDVFFLPKISTIDGLKTTLISFENKICEMWNQYLVDEINYWKNVDPTYDYNQVYTTFNDAKYVLPFSGLNRELNYEAIQALKEEEKEIYRFTWRFVDVK
ncbi:aromatic motif membrane protein [[Mycoplasma] anseris]|nr:aromatic motif membrane protein [[Mycoplasma] anseris]